uniref:Secreted protein n=1 Tax=Rubinisphaera brasiliensis (strain ATCC 49424 / DSM 5305 / JCM 21570 / IAM 15109 / NBRC 103401 / IFAM 1448) TaxID=756272 RepID=F0SLS0_RUBBR|nr:putative secreted protein [Rubinisphaera brasiliensis DSM 5305]
MVKGPRDLDAGLQGVNTGGASGTRPEWTGVIPILGWPGLLSPGNEVARGLSCARSN